MKKYPNQREFGHELMRDPLQSIILVCTHLNFFLPHGVDIGCKGIVLDVNGEWSI